MEANAPPRLYVRQGRLVRIRADEHGRPIIDAATEAILKHRLARVADFKKVVRGVPLPAPPPDDVVRDLLALGAWPGLPPLEAVTEVPVIRADGSVIGAPGYDRPTRLVYCPAPGLIIPPVPDAPTGAQVEAALAVVDDLIGELPFADDASRAN